MRSRRRRRRRQTCCGRSYVDGVGHRRAPTPRAALVRSNFWCDAAGVRNQCFRAVVRVCRQATASRSTEAQRVVGSGVHIHGNLVQQRAASVQLAVAPKWLLIMHAGERGCTTRNVAPIKYEHLPPLVESEAACP